MEILNHFNKNKTDKYIAYDLNDDELDTLIEKLINDFRLSYISDKVLSRNSKSASLTNSEFLEKYIIPDVPNIVSGDFGELLSHFAVRESFQKKGYILFVPEKFRWKDSKNKPSPGSDSIMFHLANSEKPSEKDLIVTVESKMKAVKSNKQRIQEAINDASKDKLSRMAKTLNWLEEKYARQGKEKRRKMILRFCDPATFGSFQKQHKAVAIIDKTLLDQELSNGNNNPHSIIVIIFSIKELKNVYEKVREKIINSANA